MGADREAGHVLRAACHGAGDARPAHQDGGRVGRAPRNRRRAGRGGGGWTRADRAGDGRHGGADGERGGARDRTAGALRGERERVRAGGEAG